MTRINLLPWRDELKKERKIQFGIMMGAGALAGVLAWGIGHWHYEGLIEHQEYRNQVLQNEIKVLDQRIAKIKDLEATKSKLIARMNVIQELQQGRPQIVHLFHQLATTLPEGVYVTGIKQSGGSVAINGVAESNARISSFMERLDQSDWLTSPKLEVIQVKQQQNRRLSQYTLRVQQTQPNAAPADAKASTPKASKPKASKAKARKSS